MRLPYPTVTVQCPFLYITVNNLDLTQYANNVGTTQLMVNRVQKRGGAPVNYPWYQPMSPIYYPPLEQNKNKFTFVMDSQLFQYAGGRYAGYLQYNGVWIGRMEFIFDKPPVELDGQQGHMYGI